MYIDKQNLFSDAQAITADAASTNVVDLGQSTYDHGPGNPLVVQVNLPQAFNTLTSLTFQVQTDDDEAFGSSRNLTALTVELARLTLGAAFTIPLPLEGVERYVRMYYDVTGTNPTTGQVDAFLTTADMIQQRSFRDA